MNSSFFNTSPDTLGYVYAAMLLAGGLLGAVRRGSLISLLAGGLTAAGQAYGSHALSVNRADFFPVMATNAVLFLLMAYRFFKTDKFMPAGLIMVYISPSLRSVRHTDYQCLTCANLARYGAHMVE